MNFNLLMRLLWSVFIFAICSVQSGYTQIDFKSYESVLSPTVYEKVVNNYNQLPESDHERAKSLLKLSKTISKSSVALTLEMYTEAVSLFHSAGADTSAMVFYGTTSFHYMGLSDYDSARIVLDSVQSYWKNRGNVSQMGMTFKKYGWLEYLQGNYPKSLEDYFMAIGLYKSMDEYYKSLPDIYNRVSIVYNKIGNHEAAFEIAKSTLDDIQNKKFGREYESPLLVSLLNASQNLNKANDMGGLQKMVYERYKTGSQPKTQMMAIQIAMYNKNEMINCEEAISMINRHKALSDKFDDVRFKFESAIMGYDVKDKCGHGEKRLGYLKNASKHAKIIKRPDLFMKLYAYYESYFKSKNDYKLAYKYGAKSDSIHNNILSKEKLTYISKMERARIENTARNRVDELLTIQSTKDKIIGKERMYKYIFAFIAGLILIASIWIWRLYRTRNNYAIKLTTSNEELQQSLDENRVLVKEIHHRVKNNLQVVSSLLNLQGRFEKDEAIIKAINTGKERILSISLLHQSLYQNQDLSSIEVKPYVERLVNHLMSTYRGDHQNDTLRMDIDNFDMDIDRVIPLGLIINELITNALKYGTRNDQVQAVIGLSLTINHGDVQLEVRDNGKGLPFSSISGRSKSLGMQLVKSFSDRLKANVIIDNTKGAHIRLYFPYYLNDLEGRTG